MIIRTRKTTNLDFIEIPLLREALFMARQPDLEKKPFRLDESLFL